MGYNTWYQYRTAANQADVLAMAHLLATTGLAKAGYHTVNLDDGWMALRRTASGALTWNKSKFPRGIPWLADQLHAMGLELGIYTAIGKRTCKGFPGSWAHYRQDTRTFVSWGIDFVKVDECGGLPTWTTAATVTRDFRQFANYLRQYNPDVIYSQELPIYTTGTRNFIRSVRASSTFSNMWRVTPDDDANHMALTHANASRMILRHLADDWNLHGFARPGHWNDLDMVAPRMPATSWTLSDLKNQLSVWAEEASPLLISANLATLTRAELAALGNPCVITIDQSGQQASHRFGPVHGIEGLRKPYPRGGVSVLFANTARRAATARFTLAQAGIASARASAYNVWSGKTGTLSALSITLGAGQTALYVISPE